MLTILSALYHVTVHIKWDTQILRFKINLIYCDQGQIQILIENVESNQSIYYHIY